MNRYILFVVLVLLFSCSSKKDYELIDFAESREYVKNCFNHDNNGILNPIDSCLFIDAVDSGEFNRTHIQKVLGDFVVCNYTFRYTNFSFSLLKKMNSDLSFYGNFDVFYLRHEQVSQDSAVLVPFDSDHLNSLVNKYANIKYDTSDNAIGISLTSFLYQLYFNDVKYISTPIFQVLDVRDLDKYVSKGVYDELVKRGENKLVLFLDKYFGVIAFRWQLDNSAIKIEEFLVPFRQMKMFRDDTGPNFESKCLSF